MNLSAFRLERFEVGQEVFIWKGTDMVDGSSAHGKRGIVRRSQKGNLYVELDDGRRIYWDSESGFMTEEEFSVLEVMTS